MARAAFPILGVPLQAKQNGNERDRARRKGEGEGTTKATKLRVIDTLRSFFMPH